MKIVYHKNFENSNYAENPAADEGRIKCILDELEKLPFLKYAEPQPAGIEDLKLVHSDAHIKKIMKKNQLFEIASLSAGGAIEASKIAYDTEPSFGLIRPPGHHASPNSAWGFCYFNNMAIALEKLREEGKIEGAYVLDFDLHTGDGNINALGGDRKIEILNPKSEDREAYLEEISNNLEEADHYDIIGVSAGFDEHVDDWGGKLTTSDYRKIGSMIKDFSEEKCKGRRFAILEGGYNHNVLGMNVSSFIKGFSD